MRKKDSQIVYDGKDMFICKHSFIVKTGLEKETDTLIQYKYAHPQHPTWPFYTDDENVRFS